MSPLMIDPDWVTLLETMTPMKLGTLGGGGVELPVSVDQLPLQFGGGRPRRSNKTVFDRKFEA